jgi:hypothetical protein
MAPMRSSLAVALVGLVSLTAAFIPSQIPRHNVNVLGKSFPKAVAPVRAAATTLCSPPSLPPFLPPSPCHALSSYLDPKQTSFLPTPRLLPSTPTRKLTFPPSLPLSPRRLPPSREG